MDWYACCRVMCVSNKWCKAMCQPSEYFRHIFYSVIFLSIVFSVQSRAYFLQLCHFLVSTTWQMRVMVLYVGSTSATCSVHTA